MGKEKLLFETKLVEYRMKNNFTLTAEEKTMVRGRSKSYQVLFLALYKAFKAERVIPNKIPKISPNVTKFVGKQIGIQHLILQVTTSDVA